MPVPVRACDPFEPRAACQAKIGAALRGLVEQGNVAGNVERVTGERIDGRRPEPDAVGVTRNFE